MLKYDPEVQRTFDLMAPEAAGSIGAALDVSDWKASRDFFDSAIAGGESNHPRPRGVSLETFAFVTSDGAERELRWYVPEARQEGAGVVYFHGGGMYHGSVDLYDGIVARYAEQSGVPFLSVDYRLAPEHPDPHPVRDCFEAFRWAVANVERLDLDPSRILVMGDSAGGGLAAGVSLLARDQGGPAPALQVLIYPMLDDRTASTPGHLVGLATWGHEHNHTAWTALLGERAGGPNVSPYAAPARATDLSGLPPAYIETGQLDLFCAEILDYAARLSGAGVQLELHVRPGMPHGFDFGVPEAKWSIVARADRIRAIQSI